MKKIPTLFERKFENHKVVGISDKVTPGMEWVLDGEGTATIKWDGSCCAIINGEFYKRYDCRKGKKPPEGFIPCDKPDKITGHWPGWVKVDENNPEDKWFREAYYRVSMWCNQLLKPDDGTYEAIGKHFQGNPYNKDYDVLIPHGKDVVNVERTFSGIKKYLSEHYIEGLVFYDKQGKPACKIKRTDFGFEWNKN